MSESTVEEVPTPAAPDAASGTTEAPSAHEGSRLEQVASSVKHAAEGVVEKVSDTIHGHKQDEAQK